MLTVVFVGGLALARARSVSVGGRHLAAREALLTPPNFPGVHPVLHITLQLNSSSEYVLLLLQQAGNMCLMPMSLPLIK